MQGKETRPVPKDAKAVTAEELKAIDDWEDKALRAAVFISHLYVML